MSSMAPLGTTTIAEYAMQGLNLGRVILLPLVIVYLVESSPPPDPIQCFSGSTANCTITNSYGVFPDRSTCHAANVVYPTSEAEIVKAVAQAAASNRKMKVATRHSHSVPKLACPGGDQGLIISTKYLRRVISVDAAKMVMTVEAGMTLKELIDAAAAQGLALPYAPYISAVTVGGLLATGAHGSSLWEKGSAVHEYVEAMRIVTPASKREGHARVRSLDARNPQLDATKVSLGVLGVISQVTFKLQQMFKRSITNLMSDDANLADRAVVFGNEHEFADMTWYPGQRKVIYRLDDRAPSDVDGDGRNDYIGFRPTLTTALQTIRVTEESHEAAGDSVSKCADSRVITSAIRSGGYGLENNGVLFTGYPVVGYQNNMQSAGRCIDSHDDALLTACPWDPRVHGEFFHQTAISVGISKVRDFILDVEKLRDMNPAALCGVELYNGILMRYVKGSSAYLGKEEDVLDFDITYFRSHDPMVPRLHEDVLEEIEQMALYKYGGLPHWGKNRNIAFEGVIGRYRKSKEFIDVKKLYDPEGLFSNEWTDQVLGIKGRPSIDKEGCALEGLCVCSNDKHCAPKQGYYCRPGKVYTDARVCSFNSSKV